MPRRPSPRPAGAWGRLIAEALVGDAAPCRLQKTWSAELKQVVLAASIQRRRRPNEGNEMVPRFDPQIDAG